MRTNDPKPGSAELTRDAKELKCRSGRNVIKNAQQETERQCGLQLFDPSQSSFKRTNRWKLRSSSGNSRHRFAGKPTLKFTVEIIDSLERAQTEWQSALMKLQARIYAHIWTVRSGPIGSFTGPTVGSKGLKRQKKIFVRKTTQQETELPCGFPLCHQLTSRKKGPTDENDELVSTHTGPFSPIET